MEQFLTPHRKPGGASGVVELTNEQSAGGPRDCFTIYRGRSFGVYEQLWSVRKMHGVIVIPFATPNEAMPLKYTHNLPRNFILVHDPTTGIGL